MPNSIVIDQEGQAREGTYSSSRVSVTEQPAQPAPTPAPGPAGAPQDPRALVQVRGQASRQVQVEGQPEAIREGVKEMEPELRAGLDADAEADRVAREDAVNAALPEGHTAAWEKAIGDVAGVLEGTALEPETLLSLVARGQPIGDQDMAPGAKSVVLSVTEQRKFALDQIVSVDALDYLADAEVLETPGVQSRVTLRDGSKLLCTNAPRELASAFMMAYPHLLLGALKGGGIFPNWNQSDV